MKNRIKFISNTEAEVTKAFAKKAVIFGTPEYKLWKEYKKDFPDAKMATKITNRKPNKNKNRSYENIKSYIMTQENSEKLLIEFEKEKVKSKVQTNPYEYILSWFDKNFPDYRESTIFQDAKNPKEEKVTDIRNAVA